MFVASIVSCKSISCAASRVIQSFSGFISCVVRQLSSVSICDLKSALNTVKSSRQCLSPPPRLRERKKETDRQTDRQRQRQRQTDRQTETDRDRDRERQNSEQ